MASLNKVMLMGNLTRDPEMRRIPSGVAVVTLGLAMNESYKSKSGERVERTIFVDVDVWDRQAETCEQYLSKGRPILVEGRLQMDEWTDKESGQKRSRMKVRADRVHFLGGGNRGGDGGMQDTAAQDTAASAKPAYKEPLSQEPGTDEEIPF